MFLTAEQAAAELHCNVDTVRRKAAEGSIPARKVGRRWLFEPEQLRAFVRGEWQSTSERPAGLGGLDSLYAVALFDAAPARQIEAKQTSTKPRFGIVSGGKRS